MLINVRKIFFERSSTVGQARAKTKRARELVASALARNVCIRFVSDLIPALDSVSFPVLLLKPLRHEALDKTVALELSAQNF